MEALPDGSVLLLSLPTGLVLVGNAGAADGDSVLLSLELSFSNIASDPMATFTKQILPATSCHNQPLLVPINHIGSKHVFLFSIVQKLKILIRSL